MAPELFVYQEKGFLPKPTDIWSLGISLFVYMTEILPFDDDSNSKIEENVLKKKLTWPKDHKFSKELIEFVTDLLSKDPLKRPTVD